MLFIAFNEWSIPSTGWISATEEVAAALVRYHYAEEENSDSEGYEPQEESDLSLDKNDVSQLKIKADSIKHMKMVTKWNY